MLRLSILLAWPARCFGVGSLQQGIPKAGVIAVIYARTLKKTGSCGAGGHYHYSPTTKKFGSWTREATLPVKEVTSEGKRSDIL